MKKKHTPSARSFAPNAAMALVRDLHTPTKRHAMTPRERSIETLNSALHECRSLVGLVATTGQMLSAENVMAAGKDDVVLNRSSVALLKDLRDFNNKLTEISATANSLQSIPDDIDFLPKAVEVGTQLVSWEETFRQVVLPLNGQVHDRITELVQAQEPKETNDVE